MSDDNSTEIPQFASLSCCLLVDSSHKSRIEIIKDIKASSLFQDIVEAGSIKNAQELLKVRVFDACIFGPSLSLEVVSSFIKKGKEENISSDCAYISIIKNAAEFHEYTDPHSVVVVPTSKRTFFESIVRGVLLANEGSVWPGVRLGDDGSLEMLEGGTWKILAGPPVVSPYVLPENFELRGTKESIKSFCESLASTPRSRIDKIVSNLLINPELKDDPFVAYFISAIKEWRDDQAFLSLKEVSHNLKKKLLEFEN